MSSPQLLKKGFCQSHLAELVSYLIVQAPVQAWTKREWALQQGLEMRGREMVAAPGALQPGKQGCLISLVDRC